MFRSEHCSTRMRSSLIALAILALAGCSTPTSPTNSEAGPLFDGGMIGMGGGRSGDDGTSTGTTEPETQPTGTGISDPEQIDGALGGN